MNISKHFAQLGHIPAAWKHSWSGAAAFDAHQLRAHLLQSFAAFSLALGTYLALAPLKDGSNYLAAVAGTSALLFMIFLFESPTLPRRLLNLLAIPLIFACAQASLNGAAGLLVAAFLLQALVAAIQLGGQEKERKAQLYCWMVYNLCLALLLF